LKVLLLWIDYL